MLQLAIIISLYVICFLMARTMYKDDRGKGKSYVCGLMIGFAGMANPWALAAVVVLVWYLFYYMKINETKVFYSAILGALTPLWVSLPFALF